MKKKLLKEVYAKTCIAIILIAVLFCASIKVFDKYGEERLAQQEQMRIEAEASPMMEPEPIETTFTPEPTYDFIGETETEEGVLKVKADLIGSFTARAYCPCAACCDTETHLTANGTTPIDGKTVAVDPEVIPLGSNIVVEDSEGNFGIFIAEDTGGAVQGNAIEFYFDSHQDAIDYGVEEVTVYTVEEITRDEYLPHEDYFYSDTYNHSNVDLVYDENIIKEVFEK